MMRLVGKFHINPSEFLPFQVYIYASSSRASWTPRWTMRASRCGFDRVYQYIYVQYQLHPSSTGTLAPVALHLASASTPTAYHLVAFVYSVHPMHHLRAELYIVPGPSRLSRILAKAEAADERTTCRYIATYLMAVA